MTQCLLSPQCTRLGPYNERSRNVYQPIPGCTHLLRFIPEDTVIYSAPSTNMDAAQRVLISKLVGIALDVAAGLRPLSHLTPTYFDPSITMHLSSWSRAHRSENLRMWMKSLHGREDGEYFGTAIYGDKQIAFTGRLAKGHNKLRAFRLL